MTRTEARELLMKSLYEYDLRGDFANKNIDDYILDIDLKDQKEYFESVFNSFVNNKKEIDEQISKYLENWDINRISKIDLAILRLSAIEILYINDVPKAVSVNEAVKLCKKFSSIESSKFVNGVLGHIE